MQWNNDLQRAIVEEWTEGCQKAKGPRAKQILRKRIANKYNLSVYVVQGIIELGATQGMVQNSGDYGKKWVPINYQKLIGDLRERVETLERKFSYLLEGIDRVVEDGETMRVHVQQLRGMARWMKRRDAIDFKDLPRLK